MKLSRILTPIVFAGVLASISYAREEPPDLQALSDSFRGNLSNLGSFQAIYSLNGEEKKLYITITVNRALNYMVASLEEKPTPSFEEMFLVLDYQPEIKSFTLYAYANNKAIKYDVFLGGLTNSLNNPLGVLAFLSEHTNSEVSKGADNSEPSTIISAPIITLRLTQDQVDLQLGCQFDTENFSASWAELSTLKNAISIADGSNEITFKFQNGHSISVSSETGLLIKDDFPNPESSGDRYIQLHSFQQLDEKLKYEALIPKFPLLIFEKQPATQFEQVFTLIFLESLGKQLAMDDDFDHSLKGNRQKIQQAILPLIRKLIHQEVVDDMDPLFTKRARDEIVMPFYQNHLKKNPNTSFNEFLDLMLSEIIRNPKALFPSEAQEFIETLKVQKEQLLSQLSETSREPISKLMDISLPVYFDALMSEYCEQIINGMRTSE